MLAVLVVIIGTTVFAALGLLFGTWIPWTRDKELGRLLVWTAVVCCWLFWIIVYMSQINPLIAPETNPNAGV